VLCLFVALHCDLLHFVALHCDLLHFVAFAFAAIHLVVSVVLRSLCCVVDKFSISSVPSMLKLYK